MVGCSIQYCLQPQYTWYVFFSTPNNIPEKCQIVCFRVKLLATTSDFTDHLQLLESDLSYLFVGYWLVCCFLFYISLLSDRHRHILTFLLTFMYKKVFILGKKWLNICVSRHHLPRYAAKWIACLSFLSLALALAPFLRSKFTIYRHNMSLENWKRSGGELW